MGDDGVCNNGAYMGARLKAQADGKAVHEAMS
jgi:hypothetical protein